MEKEASEPSNHRKSIRLDGYDYSQPGGYFITINTYQHIELFGEITEQGMRLNNFGHIVQEEWLQTEIIRPAIILDEFVIMPDHMHAILFITENDNASVVGAHSCAPLPEYNQILIRPPRSLGSIISGYKSKVTSRINALRGTPGEPVSQRNYYEHIIRSEKELDDIRIYIQGNPDAWGERFA